MCDHYTCLGHEANEKRAETPSADVDVGHTAMGPIELGRFNGLPTLQSEGDPSAAACSLIRAQTGILPALMSPVGSPS